MDTLNFFFSSFHNDTCARCYRLKMCAVFPPKWTHYRAEVSHPRSFFKYNIELVRENGNCVFLNFHTVSLRVTLWQFQYCHLHTRRWLMWNSTWKFYSLWKKKSFRVWVIISNKWIYRAQFPVSLLMLAVLAQYVIVFISFYYWPKLIYRLSSQNAEQPTQICSLNLRFKLRAWSVQKWWISAWTFDVIWPGVESNLSNMIY